MNNYCKEKIRVRHFKLYSAVASNGLVTNSIASCKYYNINIKYIILYYVLASFH